MHGRWQLVLTLMMGLVLTSWDYDATLDIFSQSLKGGAPAWLTDSAGCDAEGAYSPDGKKIVFCSLRSAFPLENLSAEDRRRFEADPAYYGEIYTMDADGSHVQRLTNASGYALDAAKIGQPLIMKVQRDGQTVDLEVIPEGRK